MPVFKYRKEGQDKYSQGDFEPFLNLPKDKLFSLDAKKDGDYRLRLMPPWSEEGAFALGTIIHFKVGAKRTHVVCPNTIGENLCPFCRVHQQIKSQEEYAADSEIIRPQYRYYSNVVDMNNPRKGVLVWGYGPQIYFPIKEYQDKGEFGDLTDVEEGRDILIARKVRGKVSDAVMPAGKPSMIQNPDWLDELVDLDKILPTVDTDKVNGLFNSHLWKVYEPTTKVPRTDSPQETPEDTKARLRDRMQQTAAPNPDEKSTVTQSTNEQVSDITARLRAKLAQKASS